MLIVEEYEKCNSCNVIFEIIFENFDIVCIRIAYYSLGKRRDLLHNLFPNGSSRRTDRSSTQSNNEVIIFNHFHPYDIFSILTLYAT